jgi:hypothetical protein
VIVVGGAAGCAISSNPSNKPAKHTTMNWE